MKATLRRTRISPKKANLVAGMVRGKSVNDALAILEVMPKKGAKTLWKVVKSAASNAQENFKQSIDELVITKILVTKGPTYKRSLPISRGRVHPIAKRTSHVTVEVGVPVDQPAKTSSKAAKAESPKAEKEEKAESTKASQAPKVTAKKSTESKTAKAKTTSKKPKAKKETA